MSLMTSAVDTTLATGIATAMSDIVQEARTREAVPPPTQKSQTESPAPSVDAYSITNVAVLIGSGADSEVIVASHTTTGMPVALKIVNKAKRSPEQSQRSRFEGLLISSVFDHPNIVKGYPIIEDDDRIVIPMELSPMGDLLSLVNRRRGLREEESRHIFRQLVEGLGHAHSKGVLHGDIKLDNVLIFPTTLEQSRRGDHGPRFAICDWGYARYANLPTNLRFCGTLTYGSPEVISSSGRFTTASDIWGLGVILYALVYATLPFGDISSCRSRICAGRFEFHTETPASDEYKSLVSAILCVNPARRPTIEQIRAHPWLTSNPSPQPVREISRALRHTDADG